MVVLTHESATHGRHVSDVTLYTASQSNYSGSYLPQISQISQIGLTAAFA